MSLSKQRVDMAKVASAHIATGDELPHAMYPVPWTDNGKTNPSCGLSRAQGVSAKAKPSSKTPDLNTGKSWEDPNFYLKVMLR